MTSVGSERVRSPGVGHARLSVQREPTPEPAGTKERTVKAQRTQRGKRSQYATELKFAMGKFVSRTNRWLQHNQTYNLAGTLDSFKAREESIVVNLARKGVEPTTIEIARQKAQQKIGIAEKFKGEIPPQPTGLLNQTPRGQ